MSSVFMVSIDSLLLDRSEVIDTLIKHLKKCNASDL